MKLEIPQPNYEYPKEVWAFFGLTFYCMQLLEHNVLDLAVHACMANKPEITSEIFSEVYKSLSRKTFGRNLSLVRETKLLPDNLVSDLEQVVKKRNDLAHRFGRDRTYELWSYDGRYQIIDELREILCFLVEVDKNIEEIWAPTLNKLGVMSEVVNQQFEELGYITHDQK